MCGRQSKINDIRSKFHYQIPQITSALSVTPRAIITIMSLIDNAASFYQVKFKEDFYVVQLKPKLDKQVDCVNLAAHLHIHFCFHCPYNFLVSLFVIIIYFVLNYYMDSNINIHGSYVVHQFLLLYSLPLMVFEALKNVP